MWQVIEWKRNLKGKDNNKESLGVYYGATGWYESEQQRNSENWNQSYGMVIFVIFFYHVMPVWKKNRTAAKQ